MLNKIDIKVLKAINNGYNNSSNLVKYLNKFSEEDIFNSVYKLSNLGFIPSITNQHFAFGGTGKFHSSDHDIWSFTNLYVTHSGNIELINIHSIIKRIINFILKHIFKFICALSVIIIGIIITVKCSTIIINIFDRIILLIHKIHY